MYTILVQSLDPLPKTSSHCLLPLNSSPGNLLLRCFLPSSIKSSLGLLRRHATLFALKINRMNLYFIKYFLYKRETTTYSRKSVIKCLLHCDQDHGYVLWSNMRDMMLSLADGTTLSRKAAHLSSSSCGMFNLKKYENFHIHRILTSCTPDRWHVWRVSNSVCVFF